ncbi:MAG: MoxR family ATPase [Oscillospiraceae bacterium]|nr:MoxR family ATPase [Oscillospiraceae bacterium]MBR1898992.1 MoxR family ATPase [Oscillospiraceae bacterium]
MQQEVQKILQSTAKVIVGKDETILQAIIAMLCGGHVLLEDVPGVGKTQLAAALSRSVGGEFHRIQLTPDIMPSDITGYSVVNQQDGSLEYRPGAAICNFLLADEINRASPKVQSALLEIMEEHQISLDGQTHILPEPFMVIATQNPVETYGTYHLPEAQMDRFFMKISMGYPTLSEELAILDRNGEGNPISNISEPVVTTAQVAELQKQVNDIQVADNVRNYIIALVHATRESDMAALGVSPRGSIACFKAVRAAAFVHGRSFVTPDDVKELAVPVLAHRILLNPKGRNTLGTPEALVRQILETLPVPAEG